jgi:hypothetical protein
MGEIGIWRRIGKASSNSDRRGMGAGRVPGDVLVLCCAARVCWTTRARASETLTFGLKIAGAWDGGKMWLEHWCSRGLNIILHHVNIIRL